MIPSKILLLKMSHEYYFAPDHDFDEVPAIHMLTRLRTEGKDMLETIFAFFQRGAHFFAGRGGDPREGPPAPSPPPSTI